MSDHLTDCGCADYGLTRRSLLKAAGAVGATVVGVLTDFGGHAAPRRARAAAQLSVAPAHVGAGATLGARWSF